MSDLRALVRIKEKELRRLEWTLMAHKAQEATGAVVPENLREELQDCRSEQQVRWMPPSFQGETGNREQDVGLLRHARFVSGCPTREIKAERLQGQEDILVLGGLPLARPVAAAQIHPRLTPSVPAAERSRQRSSVLHLKRIFLQRLCGKPRSEDDMSGARPILRELQAFLQR